MTSAAAAAELQHQHITTATIATHTIATLVAQFLLGYNDELTMFSFFSLTHIVFVA